MTAEDHVTARVFDYLEDRVQTEERASIRDNLELCAECAAAYAAAAELHRDVIATGARHITPERLVLLGDDRGLAPAEAEETHLAAYHALCAVVEDLLFGALPG